ncbi:MAG: selenide, water dikinase SelD [Pseudomonadota bacterium]|nr:selenide, water dikinase SelD [Pseudomonadota bacterium]
MIPSANHDLVLVGGGHSHALALRMLAMQPIPGVRITLISPDALSAYSGMLPGLIAGHYSLSETHVDLYRLCLATGTRFIRAAVTEIKSSERRLVLDDGSTLEYDWLSLDVGATPDLQPVGGSHPHIVPVKPVASFHQRWQQWCEDNRPLAVVGAGAGGTEMVLAIAEYQRRTEHPAPLSLISGGPLLPGYPDSVRRRMRSYLNDYGIQLREHTRVEKRGDILYARDTPLEAQRVLWCTGVRGTPVIAHSDLDCDPRGFVRVRNTLQSRSDSRVFAAGDCAAFPDSLPKAGVYAVRQAGVLAHNLRAAMTGQPLKAYRPQKRFLSLLSAGGKQAVASRGGSLSVSGGWVWRWKNRIDRAFMDKFDSQLPAMASVSAETDVPHCAGCGAKVGSGALQEALHALQPRRRDDIEAGVDAADDAAIIRWSDHHRLVQSLDFFPAFIDEPYLFGRVAALHSLSDLYAMNATPHSALANVTLAWHHPRLQGRDLQRLMAGAVRELNAAGCTLVGGHTIEGPQMAAGFTVNGQANPQQLWHKGGARPGDRLLLTKPLGTGVQLAAMMHKRTLYGPWLDSTLTHLLVSNGIAQQAMQGLPVHACTDITGFGLLGHLREICQQSNVAMSVETNRVPLLPGTLSLIEQGVQSTLSDANRHVLMHCDTQQIAEPLLTALCDPQTAGGLLFCVPENAVESALARLRESQVKVTEIGKVLVKNGDYLGDIVLR